MRLGRWWVVSAKPGVPASLPPWAAKEIVQRRLAMFDLEQEISRLRVELDVARGATPEAATRAEMRRMRCGGAARG